MAKLIVIAVSILLGLLTQKSAAQGSSQSATVMDKKQKNEIIDNLLKQLNDNYVFPEVAKEAEKKIRAYQKEGAYSKITDPKVFAETLSNQLADIVRDKHLRVRYNSKRAAEASAPDPEAQKKRDLEWNRFISRNNLGFPKVEILEGNIGYLKVDGFGPVDKVAKTCSAAMTFLNNTDALIIDLRQNGGGEPAMVQYLASHFFDGAPVHLNDLYFRPSNKTEEFWTTPVEGLKYLNKPVYILTANYTFSGGEEFAYDLQQLKRGITVGEVTGGGANPGDVVDLSKGFSAFIPTGRAINPVTKTNWEGTGVKPDVPTTAENALKEAHMMALKEVMKSTHDEDGLKYYRENLEKVGKK